MYTYLAYSYFMSSQLEQAQHTYHKALQMDPSNQHYTQCELITEGIVSYSMKLYMEAADRF